MVDTQPVTLHGKPILLLGGPVEVGQQAPDFEVVGGDLSTVNFSSFRGKPCILSSVVSLDTPVCDTQTRRFNDEVTRLNNDINILVLSMDLPFAQKRWCGAAGAKRVTTLSDHRDASFGIAYGLLIEDIRLLARATFVVNADGIVTYKEIVPEIADEPDYDGALAAVRQLP